VCTTLHVSERRACRALGQYRATQRYCVRITDEEDELTHRIVGLATKYGRYGYRRITGLLHNEGWKVNHKRVERIWRNEGLKVPKKQPKRGRLWLNDGSCIRLRPAHKNHVWSYDIMTERTHDGRAFRILNILDEYTRECLDIVVERKITAHPGHRAPGPSSRGRYRNTFDQTTGRSSPRRRYGGGWNALGWARSS